MNKLIAFTPVCNNILGIIWVRLNLLPQVTYIYIYFSNVVGTPVPTPNRIE